jgi:hypothetical protein
MKIIKVTQICIVLNLAFDVITFCLLRTEGCLPVHFYSKRQYSTEVDYSTHCYLCARLIEDKYQSIFCCDVVFNIPHIPYRF